MREREEQEEGSRVGSRGEWGSRGQWGVGESGKQEIMGRGGKEGRIETQGLSSLHAHTHTPQIKRYQNTKEIGTIHKGMCSSSRLSHVLECQPKG